MKIEGATSYISAYLRGGYKDESGEPLTPSQTPSMHHYIGSRLRCQPIFGNKIKLKVHFQKVRYFMKDYEKIAARALQTQRRYIRVEHLRYLGNGVVIMRVLYRSQFPYQITTDGVNVLNVYRETYSDLARAWV